MMEGTNQYRVVKDYFLPDEEGNIEWHDHEVFNNLEDAWAKMKRLKNSGALSCTDMWWLNKKGEDFDISGQNLSRKLPWRVEWL